MRNIISNLEESNIMEPKENKIGIGRILLIIFLVIAALLVCGYFALRASFRKYLEEHPEVISTDVSSTISQDAPDFTLPLTDGSEAKLSELLKDHEVVVLNIFASWCGPCKFEFPEIEKVYQKHNDKMEIVAVSGDTVLDSMEDMVKYKEEYGLSFLVGMSNESIDSLNVPGFPTTYIIDRNGKIAFSQVGSFRSAEDFEKVVTALMGDNYVEKQVALYTFVVMTSDNKPCPGVQVNLTSDTVNETLTTNENSMATYFTENPQDFKVTLSGLPDGYVSEETEVTTGLDSGYKILYVTKN